LVKLCDVYEVSYFKNDEMPRRTLSHNQTQFDALMKLLDRNDESVSQAWELIRMLETNQTIYKQVLNLQVPGEPIQISDQLFWQRFFESGNHL
jgi:hypothetical protein